MKLHAVLYFMLVVPTSLFAFGTVIAQNDSTGITIKEGWVQQAPPSKNITAAYMVIENKTGKATSLVSAKSDICQVVELHKMETVNEMMTMRKVDRVPVPAQGTAELKPGGYHLMIIGLKRPLKEGEEVEITLQFEGSVQKKIKIPVKNRDSM